MNRKIFIKPPSPARAMLVAQAILGVLFLLFGTAFVFIAEGEAKIFAAMFFIIWAVGCLAIIVHAIKTLRFIKKDKIEVAEISMRSGDTESEFSTRLRDLEALKIDGLISDHEYQEKRGEIMKDRW